MATSKPDVLTYRLDAVMIYVNRASDHEQALDFAYQVFSDALQGIKRDRISFSVAAKEGRLARIAPMSWSPVVSALKRFEIIEIHINPDLTVSEYPDGPLQYPVITGADPEDEKSQERSRPQRSALYKPSKDRPVAKTSKSPPMSRSSSRESASSSRSSSSFSLKIFGKPEPKPVTSSKKPSRPQKILLN
ncbi:hypothetical protein HWV62_29456 [Athelia sp. TMB]|nr:hypothetical protein HWV62_36490 [Athelia sp. TMB]KAF7982240.1 hypothetical protein HWV62_29456 [Athelia sp. TMB]